MQKVKLLAKSTNWLNSELSTVLVEVPTTKIAQLRTHRTLHQTDYIDVSEHLLSMSSNSSRAIPVEKHFTNLSEHYFIPEWTEAAKGMVGKKVTDAETIHRATELWKKAKKNAEKITRDLIELGIHKQDVSLLLSPFTFSNVILTGDDKAWEQFFELRCPKYKNESGNVFYSAEAFEENNNQRLPVNTSTAYPAIQEVAASIYNTIRKAKSNFLNEGEWHLPFSGMIDKIPYTENSRETLKNKMYRQNKVDEYEKVVKPKISASLCAKISFDTTFANDTWQKHLDRATRLIQDKHFSPFEHQYKVPSKEELSKMTSTFASTNGKITFSIKPFASNIPNWIQFRKLL